MEIDSDSDSSEIPQTADLVTQTAITITPSERITELNNIDTSISSLLISASTATAILANQPNAQSQDGQTQYQTLLAAQQAFTSAASTYFSTLSSIEVRLRRQVYALQEAGLIRNGDERDTRRGRTLNNEDGLLRRGGGEPLDPSWLNARASDGVEVGKKRELLAQAVELVQRINSQSEDGGAHVNGNG